MKFTNRQQNIINIIASKQPISISKIKEKLEGNISTATLNREIAELVTNDHLSKLGQGRSVTYIISPSFQICAPIINYTNYFIQDPDDRKALTGFNHDLFSVLTKIDLLTPQEKETLKILQQKYQANVSNISPTIYKKELTRLTIELSWKSSQIEGNTYSLLETERLFLEQEFAQNKTKEEATMLLNHKHAIEYILANPNLAQNLSLRVLEEIHSILIQDLGVNKNLRTRSVGITGTAYKPLDNVHQIKESLEKMCMLINNKDNSFEKALLALAMISYIQPFEDGNKRTGRMVSNAILIADNACPLSYRSVNSLEYKKALLIFYEQNNLFTFKQMFIEQNIFGVGNYFV